MLFELRQYRMRPDQRHNWLRFWEEELLPYLIQKGQVVVGSWVGEQDPDLFVWIRRFDDEADRVRFYEAVRLEGGWATYFLPRIDAMIDRQQSVVTRLTPTARSVIR